jgi:hypothetical protein
MLKRLVTIFLAILLLVLQYSIAHAGWKESSIYLAETDSAIVTKVDVFFDVLIAANCNWSLALDKDDLGIFHYIVDDRLNLDMTRWRTWANGITSFNGLPARGYLNSGQIAFAQDHSVKDNDNSPHRSTQSFKQYLSEKYKDITEAESRVHHTLHGPSGDIFVMGDIATPRKPDLSAVSDKHTRSRIIAKAFIKDEATLFGIINSDEIREYNIIDGKGKKGDYTIVYLRRYINEIELQNSELDIEVGQNENIRSFSARLVAVPPEVYEATMKKTLSEEEIRSIVENDLKQNNINPKSGVPTYRKIAMLSPPYVVWIVRRHFIYTINAFSGEVIEKASAEEW